MTLKQQNCDICVTLEQRKLCKKINNCITQQHIANRTDVHDLTNLELQDEIVVTANQLLSSIAGLSDLCANYYIDYIMSILGDSTVNESFICINGEEATLINVKASESFTHLNVPDQPMSENDLVYMFVTDQYNKDNVDEKDTISSTQSEVASPKEDEGLNTPNDTNGNDTCENGSKNCLSTCYYCMVI